MMVKQADVQKNDPIHAPAHYLRGGIGTIDFIEAKDFNFRIGNVIKYLSRAGQKEGTPYLQDLEKALWYLNREIQATRNHEAAAKIVAPTEP